MTAPQAAPDDRPSAVMRLGANVVALAAVLTGRVGIACGLRRWPEGWRRTLGVLLRSEPTRFALSGFGLRLPASGAAERTRLESIVAAALRNFLEGWPDAHFRLEWTSVVTRRCPTAWVDVVLLRGVGGELHDIEPHLSPLGPNPPEPSARARAHKTIVDAYNRTRQLPEVERALAMQREIDGIQPPDVSAYARRLVSACVLSFEPADATDSRSRFRPPDFRNYRTLGSGFLSVVMRPAADHHSTDVWISAHHVGLDGVPLQELISGLERAWGRVEDVIFPAADTEHPFMSTRRCSMPGERDVEEMLTFMDMSPVFALRESLNERFGAEIGGPVTFGGLLAWLLCREPELKGVRVASTVDVAASGGYDRDVDVVPLKPADFMKGEGVWDGFVEYTREFNRLVAASRARTSPLRRGMQTAGLLPAWAHSTAVYANPPALDDTFGSICVTIVREGKVFVAPMTDLGLGHGFFAIGSAELPSENGRRVTSVSIKGPAGTIANHPAILRRAIARCAEALRQANVILADIASR